MEIGFILNYETLTTNQEIETRQLIEHLNLNWEDACLSPHLNKRSVRTASEQQVRQKVYQGSSGKHGANMNHILMVHLMVSCFIN